MLKSKENIKSLDDMTPTTMRQLWTMIESTQVSTLLQLDDISLVQWLLKQLTAQQALDEPEISSLSKYISSRLHLIRDTAFSRNSAGPENH